jgi:hypothetical protein
LEYPDSPDTDYNNRAPPAQAAALTAQTVDARNLQQVHAHIDSLRALALAGTITIGDAVNLAILEVSPPPPPSRVD